MSGNKDDYADLFGDSEDEGGEEEEEQEPQREEPPTVTEAPKPSDTFGSDESDESDDEEEEEVAVKRKRIMKVSCILHGGPIKPEPSLCRHWRRSLPGRRKADQRGFRHEE
jgi:hypothetical protein